MQVSQKITNAKINRKAPTRFV